MKLEEIKKEVRILDPELSEDSPDFRAAVYLLSAANLGPASGYLKTFTGFKYKEIYKWNKNAKNNGLFKNNTLYHSGWIDDDTGGIGFWLDVLILQGLIARVNDAKAI